MCKTKVLPLFKTGLTCPNVDTGSSIERIFLRKRWLLILFATGSRRACSFKILVSFLNQGHLFLSGKREMFLKARLSIKSIGCYGDHLPHRTALCVRLCDFLYSKVQHCQKTNYFFSPQLFISKSSLCQYDCLHVGIRVISENHLSTKVFQNSTILELWEENCQWGGNEVNCGICSRDLEAWLQPNYFTIRTFPPTLIDKPRHEK